MKIKAVKRSFDIIELLRSAEGARTSEVAEELDIPVSTASDHLATLEQLGFLIVEQNEYRLSTKFLHIGTGIRDRNRVYEHSRENLAELAETTGEYTTLMIEEEGFGVHLHIEGYHSKIPSIANPGTRTLLHASACGKAILAFTDDRKTERILDRRGLQAATDNTITDRASLLDELAKIHEQGYAVDREEGVTGLYGVGMPVLQRQSSAVLGAIGVYGPSNQDIDQFISRVQNPLEKVVNTIELNMVYR